MRRHPTIGADIVTPIPFLAGAVDIIRHHHERVDGGGYPRGLKGHSARGSDLRGGRLLRRDDERQALPGRVLDGEGAGGDRGRVRIAVRSRRGGRVPHPHAGGGPRDRRARSRPRGAVPGRPRFAGRVGSLQQAPEAGSFEPASTSPVRFLGATIGSARARDPLRAPGVGAPGRRRGLRPARAARGIGGGGRPPGVRPVVHEADPGRRLPAGDRGDLPARQLAVMCSSHNGEPSTSVWCWPC